MSINTQSKRYLYWFASFSALFTIIVTVYYYLGGFKKVETAVTQNISYSIAGKEISGITTSKEEHLLFEEMKTHLDDSAVSGTLVIVNYKDDTLSTHESRRFIGILLNDEMSMIPSGLSVRELESEATFQAALVMHPLVMPNTEKIEKKLKLKADSLGYSLRSYTLEKLYSDNSVIVEMFAE